MKKLMILTIVLLVSCCSFATQDGNDEREKMLDTAAYLNKFAYVLSVMETYHNVLALQEVYDEMSMNQIDTTRIPDVAAQYANNKPMISIILDMLDTINGMKLKEDEFKYFTKANEDSRQAAKQQMIMDMLQILPGAMKSTASFLEGQAVREEASIRRKNELVSGAVSKGLGALSSGNLVGATAGMIDGVTGVALEYFNPPVAAGKHAASAGLNLAGEIIGGPVLAYASYEKRLTDLRAAYGEAKFNYDRTKEAVLHKTHKELITYFHSFAKQFGMKSEDLLNADECRLLAEKLKGGDKRGIYYGLNTSEMKRKYANFPPYWSYLAVFSIVAEDYKTAVEAGETFGRINRNLVKNDPLVARAAVAEVTGLLRLRSKDDKRILGLIDRIRDVNYGGLNAGWSYFCASVLYSRFKDKRAALEVLNSSMAELRKKFKGELWSYRDLYSLGEKEVSGPHNAILKDGVDGAPDASVGIPENADLLQANLLYKTIQSDNALPEDYEGMRRVCELDVTAAQEKLYYAGSVRVIDLWKVAEADVDAISLSYEKRLTGNMFVLQIPIRWFFLGELKIKVDLLSRGQCSSTIEERPNSRKVSLRPGGGSDVIWLNFRCPAKRLQAVDGVRVNIDHRSWPVQLLFRARQGYDLDFRQRASEDTLELKPTEITFMGSVIRKEDDDRELKIREGDVEAHFLRNQIFGDEFEVVWPRRWLNSKVFGMGLDLISVDTNGNKTALLVMGSEKANCEFLEEDKVMSRWKIDLGWHVAGNVNCVEFWVTNQTSAVRVPLPFTDETSGLKRLMREFHREVHSREQDKEF